MIGKITPGYWRNEAIENGQFAISAPTHFELATVHCVLLPDGFPDQQEMIDRAAANAAAIAAVPALISALWEISQRVARSGGDTAQADSALKRALGL